MDTTIGSANRTSADAGFTLIELLVVITVMSILAVSTGLAMSFGQTDRQASDDSSHFQTYFAQLQALSIHSRQPNGVVVTSSGWSVAQFDSIRHRWNIQGREIAWRGTVFFRTSGLRGDGKTTWALGRGPDIIFLPNGHSTAFEMRFSSKDTASNCVNDGWSGLQCSLN